VFIQLPRVDKPQFLLARGEYVGQVIDAIVTKFKLDIAPQQLQLFKLGIDGSSSRTMLGPTQLLTEVGLRTGTQLAVEFIAAMPSGLVTGVS
jgi:hypothetical protein